MKWAKRAHAHAKSTPAMPRAALAAMAAIAVAACGSSGSSFGDAGQGMDATGGGATPDGGAPDGPMVLKNPQPSYVSLVIQPANPTVTVKNGVIPSPTAFQVYGKTAKGAMMLVDGPTWSFDRPDLGTFNNSEAFTATGTVGGSGTLSVSAAGLKASTSVSVFLAMTSDPNNVAATLGPLFSAATTADPLLALDYPYNQTVFPRGLPAPVPQ